MHWFIDPIQNHYADFSGRATRKQYWMFVLIWLFISFGFSVAEMLISEMVAFLQLIVSLAIIVPAVALTTRRLHDTGRSGWWQLVAFIPIVGIFIHIYFMVQPSQEGDNRFAHHSGDDETNNITESAQKSFE